MSARLLRLGRGLSLPSEHALGKAEVELGRRLVLGGVAGAAALLAARPLAARTLSADRTSTSPEGIIRTRLEHHADADGNEFELILDSFPAGIIVPIHHHPAVGLNYVLSGEALSQYEGEPLLTLRPGDSFEDHANIPHLQFRNPDRTAPVTILIAHILKKGQPFFIPGRG